MRQLTGVLAGLLLVSTVLISGEAQTADQPETDQWRFTVNFPMVWLPDIKGKIDTDGDRTDIDIPISDILDNLSTGFIGELYVGKGRWELGWRSMFLGVELSSTTEPITGIPGRPPIVGKHRVEIENDLFTSDLVGAYRFHENFELYTGVRRTGNKTTFRITPREDSLINVKGRYTVIDEELYDWVLGVNLSRDFNDRWSMALQMDLGLKGDNDTNNFANAFLSYRFNERHALWFGYRYLKLANAVREQGSKVESEYIQSGPTLGWAWSF